MDKTAGKKSNILKTVTIILAFIFTVGLLTACGNSEQSVTTVKSEETPKGISSLIPDPYKMFPNSNILITNNEDDYYGFLVYKPGDGDYDAYVSACREMGFTYNVWTDEDDGSEDGLAARIFYAYDETETYQLQVTFTKSADDSDGMIAISCTDMTKE